MGEMVQGNRRKEALQEGLRMFFGLRKPLTEPVPHSFNGGLLTISMIDRCFIFLLRRRFEPGSFRFIDEDPVIHRDLIQRGVEFEIGDLTRSIEDYGEYMAPHVDGLASLMRIALMRTTCGSVYDTFHLPMVDNASCCRHLFDGLSLRMIASDRNLHVDILFRPRTSDLQLCIGMLKD
jgi:hypothetical protein